MVTHPQPSRTEVSTLRAIAWSAACEAAGHGECSASFHGFRVLARRRVHTGHPRTRAPQQVEIWIAYDGEIVEHDIAKVSGACTASAGLPCCVSGGSE